MSAAPTLLTFDIFGTVVDWRRGLRESLRARGRAIAEDEFDAVIDAQARAESGRYRLYADIVASSLGEVLGVDARTARSIAEEVGQWPLYDDARAALRRLLRAAPCVAITNSDVGHGKQIEEALGFRLSEWVCAEATRQYKPDPGAWRRAQARAGVPFGPRWWHVSAYGDYDLETARRLGLTPVYVGRPHARPGPADLSVRDLGELADRVRALS